MSGLKKSIVFLVAHFLIVLSLDKIPFGDVKLVLEPAVYILMGVAVALILLLPVFRHISVYGSLALWIIVYIGYRLLSLGTRPLLAGLDIYLTITDLALISIAVFLANEVAKNIREIDAIIEQVTFAGLGQKVFDVEDAEKDIQLEFTRSRRYGRPLSLLVIKPLAGTMNDVLRKKLQDLQSEMAERYLIANFAQAIGRVVRRTDMIIDQSQQNRFLILCPETAPEGITILAQRIQEAVSEQLSISAAWGGASFPNDALTFESLVEQAENNLLKDFSSPAVEKVPEPAAEQKSN